VATSKQPQKTLVEAVQAVYEALEPFDDTSRQRILISATSLLGGHLTPPVAAVPQAVPQQSKAPQPVAGERPLSPIELIQSKGAVTNVQKLAVFAYYRERVEGSSRFAKEDLLPYFAKAKQPPPGNYDRDFRQAVTAGWIYEDGADSYLTSKGLEAVEAGFGGKGQKRGPKRGNRAKNKKTR